MLVDSHCHLDFPDFAPELDAVVARARAAGVGTMLTISTRVRQVDRYRAIAETYPEVFFTVGTHPHQAAEEPDVPQNEIVALAAHPRCVGIGEAGLDYHYGYSPKDVSVRVFRTHIGAARQTGLPLVIHARDADEDMIAILEDEMGKGAFKAVLHCFSSGAELARVGVRLGLYVSFSGILTFKRSEDIRAIAAEVPMDRLLVETDAPFLAPLPHRGKRNEPAFVAHTNAVLAEVKGVSPDAMAQATTDNFFRLFAKAARLSQAASAA
ncbi:LuxR family transcriptional regulator [Alsobacter metallidurans]|uniref:LuxR family transcriptional regulator n=1 Tax=Alsobacter metallidurans TaxID=340221 RepID=A0A917I8F3_9HYPH|nr:TatD family hydrolase [Alsobacter metallidurans]GGH20460.1 LuxR family transcriptional regulator [Alsobacter metallidurans]